MTIASEHRSKPDEAYDQVTRMECRRAAHETRMRLRKSHDRAKLALDWAKTRLEIAREEYLKARRAYEEAEHGKWFWGLVLFIAGIFPLVGEYTLTRPTLELFDLTVDSFEGRALMIASTAGVAILMELFIERLSRAGKRSSVARRASIAISAAVLSVAVVAVVSQSLLRDHVVTLLQSLDDLNVVAPALPGSLRFVTVLSLSVTLLMSAAYLICESRSELARVVARHRARVAMKSGRRAFNEAEAEAETRRQAWLDAASEASTAEEQAALASDLVEVQREAQRPPPSTKGAWERVLEVLDREGQVAGSEAARPCNGADRARTRLLS